MGIRDSEKDTGSSEVSSSDVIDLSDVRSSKNATSETLEQDVKSLIGQSRNIFEENDCLCLERLEKDGNLQARQVELDKETGKIMIKTPDGKMTIGQYMRYVLDQSPLDVETFSSEDTPRFIGE